MVFLQAGVVVFIIALFIQGMRIDVAGVNKSAVPNDSRMSMAPTLIPTAIPTPTIIPSATPIPTNTPTPFPPTPTPIQVSADAITVAAKMYMLGGEDFQKGMKEKTSSKTQEEAITKVAYALMTDPVVYGQMKAMVEIQEELLKAKISQNNNSQTAPAPAPIFFPSLPQMHFTNCFTSHFGNINCTTQ